jgi:hypothetical protein
VQPAEHDDKEFMFKYNPSSDLKTECTLIAPIGCNQLITMRSNEGYTSFFQQAPHLDPEDGLFAGAARVIPEEPDDIPREPTINQEPDKPREPPLLTPTSQEPDKPRESTDLPTDKPRESTDLPPDCVPFTDAGFYEQVKDKPVKTNFDVEDKPSELEDPFGAVVKRK